MVVAGAVGIVALVVVVMVMRVFIVIVMVFVLLMRMLVVMVVMRMLVLRLIGGVLGAHLPQQLVRQGHLFNGRQDGLAVQLVPGVVRMAASAFFSRSMATAASSFSWLIFWVRERDDGAGGLDLVVVELAEVLHVDLHLGGVRHGDEAVQLHVVGLIGGVLHRHDHDRTACPRRRAR